MQFLLVLISVFILAAILADTPLDHLKLLGSMGVYYKVDLENPIFAILDLFRPAGILDNNSFLINLFEDLDNGFRVQAILHLEMLLRILVLTVAGMQVVWMIEEICVVCYKVCG